MMAQLLDLCFICVTSFTLPLTKMRCFMSKGDSSFARSVAISAYCDRMEQHCDNLSVAAGFASNVWFDSAPHRDEYLVNMLDQHFREPILICRRAVHLRRCGSSPRVKVLSIG